MKVYDYSDIPILRPALGSSKNGLKEHFLDSHEDGLLLQGDSMYEEKQHLNLTDNVFNREMVVIVGP